MSNVRPHMPRERMPKIAIAVLAVLLVSSNTWWLYHAVDHGVTLAYRDQVLYEAANTNSALSKVSSHLMKGKTKDEADALLRTLFPAEQPYEKDGALHTTWLALQLNTNGAVAGVQKDATLQQWLTPAGANVHTGGSSAKRSQ